MPRLICSLLVMISLLFSGATLAAKSLHIPILVYHNFNPTTPGSMNLTPERLQSQVKWLIDNGYTVIPLKDAVAYLQGKRDTLPSKPVVITADDGWASDYHYLYPLAQKYHIPVTLFIYPETISSGKHALTWAQLKEMQQTGLFDIQAHTYSHPNFKQAKRHMSAENYVKFVNNELFHSKQILEEKMGTPVTLLAWPFGIYDPYLESVAKEAGYEMAFSIDARQADRDFRPMAQPRFMIVASESPQYFEAIVK